MTIKKKMVFVFIRYQNWMLQAIVMKKDVDENEYKLLVNTTSESIINLYGHLNKSPVELKSSSYKTIEFMVHKYILESSSKTLPFQIDDANDFGESFRSDVGQHLKLDNRWLDLRAPVNNAIFKIQSGVVNLFRSYLSINGFVEIHTPKLI